MRLFASLVPPAEALAHLEGAIAAIRGPASVRSPLRWTDPAQWHITLAFYGEVPDGVVPDLTQALRERFAAIDAPLLRLRGAGSFAGRTLWAGVAGTSDDEARRLADVVAAAVAGGADVGIEPDPRLRNRAHLTLARVGGDRAQQHRGRRGASSPEVGDAVRALSVYAGPAWTAGAVRLVRSRLGQGRGGGPLHEDVEVLPVG